MVFHADQKTTRNFDQLTVWYFNWFKLLLFSAFEMSFLQEMKSYFGVIVAEPSVWRQRGEPCSCKKSGETVKKYTGNVKANYSNNRVDNMLAG